MKMRWFAAPLLAMSLLAAESPGIIFDTDMGNDIDDALALAMLHSLSSLGEARLLAVTVTKANPWAPRFVSAVNTFYGREKIPIGMVTRGKTPEEGTYTRQTIGNGKHPFSDQTVDAVQLIRRVLTREPDGSVIIIQVGFSTNLAKLLVLAKDRDLIARKVKLLSVMGGDFGLNSPPEYNIKVDIPAAQRLVKNWPTPIVFSGFEVGNSIKYPASSIEKDFPERHLIADAYRNFMKMPYDRETWDLTSVLYALRPDKGFFTLSPPGTVAIDAQGKTLLIPSSSGKHRYLIVNDDQRKQILAELIQLATYKRGQ